MANKTFAGLLEYFVTTYAKKEAGFSSETLRSYYASVEQFIFWLEENEHVSVGSINASHFSKERIRLFLLHLEGERNISASTRNLRRAGIVAFLAFASEACPVYSNAYNEAKAIRIKKSPKPKKDFLSLEEYRAILECIDISKRNGFNHYLLVSVMYDTAARVDEAVRMNLEDFSFGKENSVVIFGKNSKYRRVYLTSHTVNLVKKYRLATGYETGALFLNKNKMRISDSGISFIIKKYADMASKKASSLSCKNVSPHMLRRSKATHMLLNGASLPVIQRFLGHESIKTTEVYLEIGSEAMMVAVENAGKLLFGPDDPVPISSTSKDPDKLKRLKSLAK